MIMKNKLKSYKFWMAVLGGVIVLINTLGAVFNFKVNEIAITSIFTAILGIFVILGFVDKDNEKKAQTDLTNDEQTEQDEQTKSTEQIDMSKNQSLKDDNNPKQ